MAVQPIEIHNQKMDLNESGTWSRQYGRCWNWVNRSRSVDHIGMCGLNCFPSFLPPPSPLSPSSLSLFLFLFLFLNANGKWLKLRPIRSTGIGRISHNHRPNSWSESSRILWMVTNAYWMPSMPAEWERFSCNKYSEKILPLLGASIPSVPFPGTRRRKKK